MTWYYILIITCYYSPIITSLSRHYHVILTSLLLHVIKVWLLPIISLACFISTLLLHIMSSILIIIYYWLANLQINMDRFFLTDCESIQKAGFNSRNSGKIEGMAFQAI